MKRTEYYKMADSIFVKVKEDGIFLETHSIPIEEAEKWILERFEKENSAEFVIEDGDAINEAYEESNIVNNEPILDGSEEKPQVPSPEAATTEEVNTFIENNISNNDGLEKDIEHVTTDDLITADKSDYSALTKPSDEAINTFVVNNVLMKDNLEKDLGQESAKTNHKDDFLTAVNKPSHYQGILISGKKGSMEFEAIEIIDSVINMLNLNPAASHAIGDALKYILRCGKKESDNNTTTDLLNKAKQDLLKSRWYLQRAADTI